MVLLGYYFNLERPNFFLDIDLFFLVYKYIYQAIYIIYLKQILI
jgi:hypothetical protein